MSMVLGAVYCAYIGNDVVGAALVGAGALGIVGNFIRGRRK